LLLSRRRCERRRPAAAPRMRAALACADHGAAAAHRAHPARRLVRAGLLSGRAETVEHDRYRAGLARVRAPLPALAAPELAPHGLAAAQSLVRDGIAAHAPPAPASSVVGARCARPREGAAQPYDFSAASMRSMSSSERPKWWPISWIRTWRMRWVRSSP